MLGEGQVHFTTAQPGPEADTAGRDVGCPARAPVVDRAALGWDDALARPGYWTDCDWVSADPRLPANAGAVPDEGSCGIRASAASMARGAGGCSLSPQFTRGGDVLTD
ncbi:MAG: hypothetical protein R3F59_12070 [Myxococcota bacterium]